MFLSELRLVAIAGTPVVAGQEFVDACRAAADGGATAVQVRFKGVPASDVLRMTEAVLAAVAVPVYVNDRADVALSAGATGVHLGAEDLPARVVRGFAPPGFRIGVSIGTRAEADAARSSESDYWSIGSIFASPTKPDAGTPVGLKGFRTLRSIAPSMLPVIAIGGITAATVEDLLRAGATGVAVGNALFAASDVERAANELRQAVDAALGS